MVKFCCDRCEKEIPALERMYVQLKNYNGTTFSELLLCPNCFASFKEWMTHKEQ